MVAKGLLPLLVAFFLCCSTLSAGEERREVTDLARLMAMRLALVREVAWSKCCSGVPVADPAREAAMLAALKAKGSAFSLTPGRVRAFFLPQIVASRRYQEELIGQWRCGFPRPKNPPMDIPSELRPRIDRLDTEMLRAWAAFPVDACDHRSRSEAVRVLCERGIPPGVARIATRPMGTADERSRSGRFLTF
jgi:chorismate mutase